MKLLLVALCFVAMSQAKPSQLLLAAPSIYAPLPLAAPTIGVHAIQPAHVPITYIAHPQVVLAAPAPVIQPGYVAATRGSLHIAPLPGNTPYASHHLNLAPASGTE